MRRGGTGHVLIAYGLAGMIGSYILATWVSITAAVVFNLVLMAAYAALSAWQARPCFCPECSEARRSVYRKTWEDEDEDEDEDDEEDRDDDDGF